MLQSVSISRMRHLLCHIAPRRFDLLEELHRYGPISINALAKLLKRNYKNVHDDVKALESIGLIERGED
jgi:predicted transcriptional regulator